MFGKIDRSDIDFVAVTPCALTDVMLPGNNVNVDVKLGNTVISDLTKSPLIENISPGDNRKLKVKLPEAATTPLLYTIKVTGTNIKKLKIVVINGTTQVVTKVTIFCFCFFTHK